VFGTPVDITLSGLAIETFSQPIAMRSPSFAACSPNLTLLTSQVIDAPQQRGHDPLRHQ
jgi:hypothetical protein